MKNKLTLALITVAFIAALLAAFGLVKLAESPKRLETIITVEVPQEKVIDKKLAGIANIIKNEGKIHIDTAYKYAGYIIKAADKHKINPTLIVAIISVESTFKSNAENMGTIGLMQVFGSVHRIKPIEKLYDPEYNIHIGTKILKDSIKRGGGIINGLSLYNGSYNISTAYADKVLARQARYNRLIYT